MTAVRQAVAKFGECQGVLQKSTAEVGENGVTAEAQAKLQEVLAGFACAAQCCQRGAAWLELLNVTRMWWNCARLIFNKVPLPSPPAFNSDATSNCKAHTVQLHGKLTSCIA